jgi:hypothetical protein
MNGENDIARMLRESIARGTPAEPDWWSAAVLRAHEEGTTDAYQVWLAVKELLWQVERERDRWKKFGQGESHGLQMWRKRALAAEETLAASGSNLRVFACQVEESAERE